MFNRRRGAFVIATLLFGSVAASAQQAPAALTEAEQFQQALFERVASSVVFISNGRGFGSGFFVDEHGLILTNAHVVGRASRVTVVLRDGRRFEANVVKRAANDVDLALVRVPQDHTVPLALASVDRVRVGSWAAAVGHGEGGIWTFNTGIISNIYPSGAQRPVIQTQIPLNPGASGGPVVDLQGRVVGIVTAGIETAQAINFAIKSDYALQQFPELVRAGVTITAPAGVPVFVDGVHVGVGPTVQATVENGTHEVMAVIGGQMVKQRVTFPATRAVALHAPIPTPAPHATPTTPAR